MSDHPIITYRSEIEMLVLKPGQTLTVYLRKTEDHESCEQLQVEMRLLPDGQPQIFLSNEAREEIYWGDWESWYEMPKS